LIPRAHQEIPGNLLLSLIFGIPLGTAMAWFAALLWF